MWGIGCTEPSFAKDCWWWCCVWHFFPEAWAQDNSHVKFQGDPCTGTTLPEAGHRMHEINNWSYTPLRTCTIGICFSEAKHVLGKKGGNNMFMLLSSGCWAQPHQGTNQLPVSKTVCLGVGIGDGLGDIRRTKLHKMTWYQRNNSISPRKRQPNFMSLYQNKERKEMTAIFAQFIFDHWLQSTRNLKSPVRLSTMTFVFFLLIFSFCISY